MSNQIETARVEQFRRGIDMLVQQRGSRVRGAVRLETGVVGKHAYFDQVGSTAAIERTGRHTDTPLVETPHARRRVTMRDYEWADLIDDPDKLKILNDPTNSYSQAAAWAMGRTMDDLIIGAMFGSADTGESGGTAVALPAAQKIAVGGTGLTVTKLRDAKRILMAAENDPGEEWYIAVTAQQLDDLLGETEVTSSDFNNVRALVDGTISQFMGFTFIHTERLTTDSNGDRQVPAWRKSGVALALAKDSTGRIDERADKSYSTQVFYSMSIGATRMEEEALVEIACSE